MINVEHVALNCFVGWGGGTHSTSAQCSGEQITRGNTERYDTAIGHNFVLIFEKWRGFKRPLRAAAYQRLRSSNSNLVHAQREFSTWLKTLKTDLTVRSALSSLDQIYFGVDDMDYDVDVIPLKATFLVKEEVQKSVFKPRGIACAVCFKGKIFLLTSSSVVEATDNRKKHIAERFSRKHSGDYRLDVSIFRQLGNFTFLTIIEEYPRASMGTSWVISLNLELPSSERKALGCPLSEKREFELQCQWDGNSTSIQVITTKSIDWTSILGVPIIIENIQSNKRQSGRFSVIGVVGLTSEEKLCLCYLDQLEENTGSLGKFCLVRSHIHLGGLIFSN